VTIQVYLQVKRHVRKYEAVLNQVFHAVRLTLGPEGQNAILPRTFNRGPRLTNDGVTVSETLSQR